MKEKCPCSCSGLWKLPTGYINKVKYFLLFDFYWYFLNSLLFLKFCIEGLITVNETFGWFSVWRHIRWSYQGSERRNWGKNIFCLISAYYHYQCYCSLITYELPLQFTGWHDLPGNGCFQVDTIILYFARIYLTISYHVWVYHRTPKFLRKSKFY